MNPSRAPKLVEVKKGMITKVLFCEDLWRQFLAYPSETTNEFIDWMRTELARNQWIKLDDVILEIGRRLARIYVWAGGRRKIVLRDLEDGVPTPMILESMRDQPFFHMNLHFSIGNQNFMIEMQHFASCPAFKTSEILYGMPYNTLITAPSKGVELRVGMGMKLGFEPILDDELRQERLFRLMRQFHMHGAAQIPVWSHDEFRVAQDRMPELIHIYYFFIFRVICGRDIEETRYFLQMQSAILRGERTRMIGIFQTSEQQVGKSTIININNALGVDCISVSNADQLLGKFNPYLLRSLVFCEEFTSDRQKMMEIYQRIKAASTAETEQIEDKKEKAVKVALRTNIMIARNDASMPFIEWGDNRTALFACEVYDNKAFFDRLYDLLRDPTQLQALFVWLTTFSDGNPFDGKERPASMRRRIAAKAYGNSKPIEQVVSNVFCGYAFNLQSPPGIVYSVGNDHQFDRKGFVQYLIRCGACKTDKTAEGALFDAVQRGILASIPSNPERYKFGPRCATLFALGVDRNPVQIARNPTFENGLTPVSGTKRPRTDTDDERTEENE